MRVRVWCEDSRHERFARELLCAVFGVDRRALTVSKPPKGEGAASAWVLRKYEEEVVPSYRRDSHQAGLAFVVIVDGDCEGLNERLDTLEAHMRDATDRRVFLIPCWSIETWLLWLGGENVVESEKTKHRITDKTFRQSLQNAISKWSDPARSGEPPSLAAARVDLKRLPDE